MSHINWQNLVRFVFTEKNRTMVHKQSYWPGKTIELTEETSGKSIFERIDCAIKMLVHRRFKDVEWVAFSHDDLVICEPELLNFLDDVPQKYGMIGIAGSITLNNDCVWWQPRVNMRGIWVQGLKNKNWTINTPSINAYGDIAKVPSIIDAAVVDGCFMLVRKEALLTCDFTELGYPGGFDFYDLELCMQILNDGHKVGIAKILVRHESVGDVMQKDEFYKNREHFIEKWKKKIPIKL